MPVIGRTLVNAVIHSYVIVREWAGKRESEGQDADQVSERWPMEKKWMFIAVGYALLLASLEFMLDAGIASMIVAG
jgi:hypothetical protein